MFSMFLVRMYPPIVLTIPLYPVFVQLHLSDTIWVLIILYSAFSISLSCWLMKIFIDEIPLEIEEAASIDGATTFQIITKILLPLSIRGIVTTIVFVTIFAWKEYMFAFIFTGTSAQTAPVLLSQLQDSIIGIQWGPLFAATTLQLLPILILVIGLQGLIIKGLSGTGVKG